MTLLAFIIAWALALAPAAAAAPTPDPAPQAHHRKVTILPACAHVNGLHTRSYVVGLTGKTVTCAGVQR